MLHEFLPGVTGGDPVLEISDVQVVSGLLELHGVVIDSTDRDGELIAKTIERAEEQQGISEL